MSEKFETSRTIGAHAQLQKLTGAWKGSAKTWFEPDKLADESPVSGTMKAVLGGKFILHEYTGSISGKPLEGMALIGYDLNLGRYQCAWIDSFHNGTAIMFSNGKRGEDQIRVLGGYTYLAPGVEQHWGWRTEIEILNDNEIVITAFNISPEGEEAKATEVVYRRES